MQSCIWNTIQCKNVCEYIERGFLSIFGENGAELDLDKIIKVT